MMNRWVDSAGGINYRPTSNDYGVPEPDQCPRCTFGLGEHSCWRAEIQKMPDTYRGVK